MDSYGYQVQHVYNNVKTKYPFLNIFLLYIMCMCMLGVCARVCRWCGGQRSMFDPLDLELNAV